MELAEHPDAVAQVDGDEVLAEDLNQLCQVVREGMRDRSRPLYRREQEMVERMLADAARYRRMEILIDSMPPDAGIFYPTLVERASTRGVDFECEPLARMVELRAADRDDVDESLFPPITEELARVCALAEEARAARSLGWAQLRFLDRGVTRDVRHWRVRDRWAHPPDPMSVRYAWFQTFARRHVPAWECPALEAIWEAQ